MKYKELTELKEISATEMVLLVGGSCEDSLAGDVGPHVFVVPAMEHGARECTVPVNFATDGVAAFRSPALLFCPTPGNCMF